MVNINSNSDPLRLILQFNRRLNDFQRSRSEINQEVVLIGAKLDEFIGSIDTLSQRLETLKKQPKMSVAISTPGVSLDDFKIYIEKLLQGSLEAATDKISDRIMLMLKELKGLAGTAREAKIQEIREAAASEMVDLSTLFTHEEAQSNLGEVGVEEKESKGIDSSLEKLRKMRGLKPKGPPQDTGKG